MVFPWTFQCNRPAKMKYYYSRTESLWCGNWILPYSQSYPHDLPRMTSLSSTGGGWQATRPVSRVKWLWRHRQIRRNGNVAWLDSSNFPTFTSEKYLFGTYNRKIINIYCPLVTAKSTNPRVKITCPCLGKPRQASAWTKLIWHSG